MSTVRDATDALLADRPSLEADLRELLEHDEELETWSFEEIPADSGAFGELVSRGIVEAVDGEYRLTDPQAVRRALEGADRSPDSDHSEPFYHRIPAIGSVDIDPVAGWGLLGCLVLVGVMRTAFSWSSVFRENHVVLLGNDPYFYRYWVAELLRTNASLGTLPPGVRSNDVLMIATTTGVTSLLGGEQALGYVLAWYPVVAAVVVGGLVYLIGVVTFEDRRVALASVAFYAVTPIVAYRSAFGYADHHAFDYLLITVAVAGLVLLASERAPWGLATWRRCSGTVLFGGAIAAQVHAWRAGPLFLLPVALYLLLRAPLDVRAGHSPVRANAWTGIALGVAAVLAAAPSVAFDWSAAYRAFAPALLFAGWLLVVLAGDLFVRFDLDARTVLGVELVGVSLAAVVAWAGVSAVNRVGSEGIRYFTRTGQSSITETYSLLSPAWGFIFTPLFYLGPQFYLGCVALAWTVWCLREIYRPEWLVLVAYAGTLFLMATVQLRFAAQLGIVMSLFCGLGFVSLVAAVDAAPNPRPVARPAPSESAVPERFRDDADGRTPLSLPDRDSAVAVLALFVLISGVGGIQTAGGTADLRIDSATVDATAAIDDHAAKTTTTWPNNYVFSDWDRNRIYNTYVNDHAKSYWFAREYYTDFVSARTPGDWYETLAQKPVGYVVIERGDGDVAPSTMQNRLWEHWGGASGETDGLGHYRAVYANEEQKVFQLVEGAVIVGQATPGSVRTVSTTFSAGGSTHTFERRATTRANGWYSVRVPYTGTYDLGASQTSVSEAAVETGSFAGSTGTRAHWPLNATSGPVAFDVSGGHHGWVRGPTWTESGLAFDGNDTVQVPNAPSRAADGNVSLSVTFRTTNATEYVDDVPYPRLAGTAPSSQIANTSGYYIGLADGRIRGVAGNGTTGTAVRGGRVDDGNWHTATLVRAGETIRLSVDGQTVGETRYSGPIPTHQSLTVGASPRTKVGYVGEIRAVTVTTGTDQRA